ncbi:MAG: glutamate racemase [Treponema sp.]|nr:glutamate racemase [Treponema sp.]
MSCDFAFLDSGTGGIPYMLELKKKCPECTCVYLGDTAHFPYGEKSIDEVCNSASDAIDMIVKRWNPRTLVIACNTISVTALDMLRKKFPALPIVGTVPAIKLAAAVTKNKCIGLLATNATVNHPYCKKLIDDFASDCKVFSRGDPELIDFIEHNLFTATQEEKLKAVKPACDFFMKNGCDTVILGCTHFTHLAEEIRTVAGKNITVVDSRDGVSKQALRVEQKCEADSGSVSDDFNEKNMSFFVTSATQKEAEEYRLLCEKLSVPWGGIISYL